MSRHLPRNDIRLPRSDTRTIGFLLVPDFSLLSYSSAIEPLRAANLLSGKPLYRWRHVSTDGAPVAASSGVSVAADGKVGDRASYDTLLVFAAGNPSGFDHAPTLSWLRALARRGVAIGGVSGGPYLLARAGLLDGHRCTIHWMHLPAFLEEFPHLRPSMNLYEIDRGRLTCAGGIGALDMVCAMIEADHGQALAVAVREWFLHGHRPADHPQRPELFEQSGARSPHLAEALKLMRERLELPLSRDELAGTVGLSVRQLERLFAGQLGATIGETYRSLRLDRARILVRESVLPITEIAVASGFGSASHFSRCFKERYGGSPAEERRKESARTRRPTPLATRAQARPNGR
ncbi:MAG: GlxA family transcriptional regulator [Bauldia sp.]|nr:GlxA family transcriptional regulator [Bauldia sp.]